MQVLLLYFLFCVIGWYAYLFGLVFSYIHLVSFVQPNRVITGIGALGIFAILLRYGIFANMKIFVSVFRQF